MPGIKIHPAELLNQKDLDELMSTATMYRVAPPDVLRDLFQREALTVNDRADRMLDLVSEGLDFHAGPIRGLFAQNIRIFGHMVGVKLGVIPSDSNKG